jgi:hypothetical protein
MSFYINGLSFNFSDFLVIKLRYSLSFNALHVNNLVDFFKTRLKTCLCALSLSGLPFKSHLTPQSSQRQAERVNPHFIGECGPWADDFKIACLLMHHAAVDSH